jgi:steroid 5-alpha reductase family enzyme
MTETAGPTRFSRVASFAIVTLAYVVATAVALWIVADTKSPLTSLIVADVVATLIVFAFSVGFDNSSIYDPYWSVAPPLIALHWIAYSADGAVPLRQVVVTVLVFAWAIRLTANWARGWPGLHHEDWRYTDLYANSGMGKWTISFLGIHLFPTIIVLVGTLSFLPALAYGSRPFNLLDVVATIVTAGAVIIEWVADEQLRAFNRTKQPGDIIATGMWAHARHPNYFGEMSFWSGLFLFGFAAAPSFWWTVIGPLAMIAMFRWASIPMLDNRSLARRPGYEEHMRRVNAVVPWPR